MFQCVESSVEGGAWCCNELSLLSKEGRGVPVCRVLYRSRGVVLLVFM